MARRILILLLCLLSKEIYGQDTCNRIPFTPIYILNNPSLEDNALSCSSTFTGVPYWYPTTSEMQTGFLNSCTNYIIPDNLIVAASFLNTNICLFPIVPQPVPDGKGVVAVSDYGYDGGMYIYPFHKSYTSTCLTSPLRKDTLYRLDFFAGFGGGGNEYLSVHDQVLAPGVSHSPETFGLFGLGDCSSVNMPIPIIGCPAIGGWIPLGYTTVSGAAGTWVKTSILFKPSIDIQAISLGPGCDTNFTILPISSTYQGQPVRTNNYSYFLDSLQFYKSNVPPPVVSLVSGNSCSASVVLQMQPAAFYTGSNLQWYRNDTAISGQQSNTITIARRSSGSDAYRCQVQNDSVCLVSDPFLVNWTPLPNASALGSPDTSACLNDTVLLNAFTDTSFSYQWQNGSTLPYFAATQSGTYTVTISNQCGTARAQKTIQFSKCDYNLYVPNAFTPNGDGNNDIFKAHYFTIPARFSMQIFNRNGLEVFSSTDPSMGWDGNYKGVRQPVDTYVWVVVYTDLTGKEHTLKGTVVLVR